MSVDGTWQRRGFSSLNGSLLFFSQFSQVTVTAISSDSKKCLDYEVMSKTCKGLDGVFQRLGIKKGKYTMTLGAKTDQCRIYNMNRKSTERTKRRRKQLRAIKKGFEDDYAEKEGQEYKTGGF